MVFCAQQLWPNPVQISMSVGKPRPSGMPAQPETSMTHSIDGPEEMGGWAITSPTVSAAAQVSVKTVPWVWTGKIGEEQLQREAQAGCRCGSIVPTSRGSSPTWMHSAHSYNWFRVDPCNCASLVLHPQENLIWPRCWGLGLSHLFLPLLWLMSRS